LIHILTNYCQKDTLIYKMEIKLKEIQVILNGLMYSRDIEDIVFDNNRQKNTDPNKCHGKRVIDGYNAQALHENQINQEQISRKLVREKEIFTLDDTKHFCIGVIKPRDTNNVGYNIMTFYFKYIIIIETTQNCIKPEPPKYLGFRHYFTPDILLFLKHFHKTEFNQNAMAYVQQNPHYFKHHTMDTYNLIKKANDILTEIKQQYILEVDNGELCKQQLLELVDENQNLKNRIIELEKKIC
jgi:hypothetical protein